MVKNFAIKGQFPRGNDIIDILEMLDGCNIDELSGENETYVYYIDFNNCIRFCTPEKLDDNYIIFSLDDFITKFPYKIGDKVIDVADGCPGIIDKIKWDENICDMKYCVSFDNGDMGWYTNDTIKFYQSENSKDIATSVEKTQSKMDIGHPEFMIPAKFMITHMLLPETPHNVNDELEYKIIDGYEFDRAENGKIILKVVKPEHKYPTTYGECCDVIGYDPCEDEINCYKSGSIESFVRLLICRGAYWKIAGVEMGLDKPWEPDFGADLSKYYISFHNNKVDKGIINYSNKILVFPTEEMQDAFYENFKDLIEKCKEFL